MTGFYTSLMNEDEVQGRTVDAGRAMLDGRIELDSVRRVYVDQQNALTRELARLHRERQDPPGQSGELKRMLDGYGEQHRARAALTAAEALRFQRLHQRMTDSVRAQEEFVHRLSRAVEGRQNEWRDRNRRHRSRRAGARRVQGRGPGWWTMLKDSSSQDE